MISAPYPRVLFVHGRRSSSSRFFGNWVFPLPENRLENLGRFSSQPSRLVDQLTSVPEVRPRHNSIADFSELQPKRRQMVSACELLKP